MELLILNPDLEVIEIIDAFESLIWTERYCGYGDFEVLLKVSESALSMFNTDNFVKLTTSDRLMTIEECRIKSDVETGSNLIIKGRSMESILDRRIVWEQTLLNGDLQNGIKKLIDENVISPTIPEREIPNFVFDLSVDTAITDLTVDTQFTRDIVYDAVKKLCAMNDIGFKVTLSGTDLKFNLYSGTDRSFTQFTNPYVIFSPEFENIINSDYFNSTEKMKTLTVVAGEGEGAARKTKVVGEGEGYTRREMYTDARDLSQTVDEVTLTDEQYYAQLEQRGIQNLSENILESTFDSKVDTTRMYQYEKDFFLGDIVQIVSEYGIQARARITEIIRSESTSGSDVYPTFTIIY